MKFRFSLRREEDFVTDFSLPLSLLPNVTFFFLFIILVGLDCLQLIYADISPLLNEHHLLNAESTNQSVREVVALLDHACKEAGFFYVVNPSNFASHIQ